MSPFLKNYPDNTILYRYNINGRYIYSLNKLYVIQVKGISELHEIFLQGWDHSIPHKINFCRTQNSDSTQHNYQKCATLHA